MRLSTRRRVMVAMVVMWPLGWVYLDWSDFNVMNIVRVLRWGDNSVSCADWRNSLNSCVAFSPTVAWIEIAVFAVLILVILTLVARWALAPVRAVTDVISQFGPGSLGLRILMQGPLDETQRLADTINSVLDRVAEGYDAQRRFASSASHELRTPLATQRALIEVSLCSALTAEQLQLLSRQLIAMNERNEALIEGLLVLAETETGLLTTSPQRLDLTLAETIRALQPFADERDVHISTELEPVTVAGERLLLERLASNLVQNAIKYNVPGGRVRVKVSMPATLLVANSGPPIPPEHVNGLFEPFRRASGDRLDHGGGAGLGLTIVRSIVAAHLGSVSANANPGGGLAVTVDFQPRLHQ